LALFSSLYVFAHGLRTHTQILVCRLLLVLPATLLLFDSTTAKNLILGKL